MQINIPPQLLDCLSFAVCEGSKVRDFIKQSAWIKHVPFSFCAMASLKPRKVVELGTHYGTSFFAFCKAAQLLNLDTILYAIDTWRGDEHSGLYGDEVYDFVRDVKMKEFPDCAYLLRSTFEESLPYFGDQEIDLLHIDGLHTYEAVKNDFENWLPKISEKGVAFFHDTHVRERNFGVWRYIAEISEKYPVHDFKHGYGLGVVLVGKNIPEDFLALIHLLNERPNLDSIFAHLGIELHKKYEFERQISLLNQRFEELNHHYHALKNSKSYRLGRLLTWPIRLLRRK